MTFKNIYYFLCSTLAHIVRKKGKVFSEKVYYVYNFSGILLG